VKIILGTFLAKKQYMTYFYMFDLHRKKKANGLLPASQFLDRQQRL
jgi:hypothetical protein